MDGDLIAVTGASGYVGSIIVAAVASDWPVRALVRSPRQPADIGWSLSDSEEQMLAKLSGRGIGHLIHAAWDMTSSDPAEIERTCVEGTRRLLSAARRAGIARLTLISTVSAFADARSVYGRAKYRTETIAASYGASVLRLGLVYGPEAGGLFGNLRRQVRTSQFIPLIGDGKLPQYLLPAATLADVVQRAARGELDGLTEPLTLANPEPVPLRHLIEAVAAEAGREVRLVPVPWRILYVLLRAAELAGLRLPARSDGVISYVRQAPALDFSVMERLGIRPPAFALAS